eukprot:401060-Hanusia_phi.AAC.2
MLLQRQDGSAVRSGGGGTAGNSAHVPQVSYVVRAARRAAGGFSWIRRTLGLHEVAEEVLHVGSCRPDSAGARSKDRALTSRKGEVQRDTGNLRFLVLGIAQALTEGGFPACSHFLVSL